MGRYVTIFADYSTVPKPYEIALCQYGVLGEGTPIVDEEICSNKLHADAGTIDHDKEEIKLYIDQSTGTVELPNVHSECEDVTFTHIFDSAQIEFSDGSTLTLS